MNTKITSQDINLHFYEFDNGGGTTNPIQYSSGNNLTSTEYNVDWYTHSKGGTFPQGRLF